MIVVGLLFILTGALSQIPGGLGGQKPADESVREALSDHQVCTVPFNAPWFCVMVNQLHWILSSATVK